MNTHYLNKQKKEEQEKLIERVRVIQWFIPFMSMAIALITIGAFWSDSTVINHVITMTMCGMALSIGASLAVVQSQGFYDFMKYMNVNKRRGKNGSTMITEWKRMIGVGAGLTPIIAATGLSAVLLISARGDYGTFLLIPFIWVVSTTNFLIRTIILSIFRIP